MARRPSPSSGPRARRGAGHLREPVRRFDRRPGCRHLRHRGRGLPAGGSANEKAAEALGLNVLERINAPAEQASYRAEAEKIADLDPDAVLVQAGSTESATLIKAAAEAGLSLNWIGETGWSEAEFIGSLGTDPIATQKSIGFASFAPHKDDRGLGVLPAAWDGQTNCAEGWTLPALRRSNQYAFSTYDLIVQTALAVEAGGSYKASDWAPAMHEVGDAPGEVCYTYLDCLALIREGQDIDYEGVTGPGTYSDGGVNCRHPGVHPVQRRRHHREPVPLDADAGSRVSTTRSWTPSASRRIRPTSATW